MAEIVRILRIENKADHAIIHVRVDDGSEATVFVGGEIELYFHKGFINAFVKKAKVT